MAKAPQGINGPFIGRVGNVIGYMLDGVNVVRSIGQTVGERTPGQLANQLRMALISNLATTIEEFLIYGFQSITGPGKQKPRNHAVSINKEVAVKGVYPNLQTDFEKLVVAAGTIPAPKNAQVKLVDNNLEFVWDADIEKEATETTDQVMLLAYIPAIKKAIIMASGARRSIEKEILQLPAFEVETVVETYLAFVSDDRNNASNSVYLGQVIITPVVETQKEKMAEIVNQMQGEKMIISETEEDEITTGTPYKPDEGLSDMIYFGNLKPTHADRMKIMSPLLSYYIDEINVGYLKGQRKTTPWNRAMSYNINAAIHGDDIYQIHYPSLVFSAGKRETAWSTKLYLMPDKRLNIKWAVPQTAKMKVIGDDKAYFILYNGTKQKNIRSINSITRKDLSATLKLADAAPGDIIYAWMFFASPDGKVTSNSDYLGCVEVLT